MSRYAFREIHKYYRTKKRQNQACIWAHATHFEASLSSKYTVHVNPTPNQKKKGDVILLYFSSLRSLYMIVPGHRLEKPPVQRVSKPDESCEFNKTMTHVRSAVEAGSHSSTVNPLAIQAKV